MKCYSILYVSRTGYIRDTTRNRKNKELHDHNPYYNGIGIENLVSCKFCPALRKLLLLEGTTKILVITEQKTVMKIENCYSTIASHVVLNILMFVKFQNLLYTCRVIFLYQVLFSGSLINRF